MTSSSRPSLPESLPHAAVAAFSCSWSSSSDAKVRGLIGSGVRQLGTVVLPDSLPSEAVAAFSSKHEDWKISGLEGPGAIVDLTKTNRVPTGSFVVRDINQAIARSSARSSAATHAAAAPRASLPQQELRATHETARCSVCHRGDDGSSSLCFFRGTTYGKLTLPAVCLHVECDIRVGSSSKNKRRLASEADIMARAPQTDAARKFVSGALARTRFAIATDPADGTRRNYYLISEVKASADWSQLPKLARGSPVAVTQERTSHSTPHVCYVCGQGDDGGADSSLIMCSFESAGRSVPPINLHLACDAREAASTGRGRRLVSGEALVASASKRGMDGRWAMANALRRARSSKVINPANGKEIAYYLLEEVKEAFDRAGNQEASASATLKRKAPLTQTMPGEAADKGETQERKKARPQAKEISSGPADGMPDGWTIKVFERSSGATAGTTDKYWYSPQTSKKFRSKAEVYRYLAALEDANGDEEIAWQEFRKKDGDSRKKKQSTDDPGNGELPKRALL